MPHKCNVCQSHIENIVYQSTENRSITSLAQLIKGQTSVYFCETCTHLNTIELPEIHEYYANQYHLNTKSDDEDQLYDVQNGVPVYRTDKQAELFLEKVNIDGPAAVLDYGCGKAATLKKICEQDSRITPHLFDVTDNHSEFWHKFADPENTACFGLPNKWHGKFDIVTSFYAIEHIPNLDQCMTSIFNMLKEGGTLYFMVPDCSQNIADLIVADHVNHFSLESLQYLLAQHQFSDIEIDSTSFAAAFVVKAVKSKKKIQACLPHSSVIDERQKIVAQDGKYWKDIVVKLKSIEESLPRNTPIAIYGAGFYGRFILSCLNVSKNVACFVDQNKHLKGTHLLDIPIRGPEDLPTNIKHLYIGLNPANAQTIVDSVPALNRGDINVYFL